MSCNSWESFFALAVSATVNIREGLERSAGDKNESKQRQ